MEMIKKSTATCNKKKNKKERTEEIKFKGKLFLPKKQFLLIF